MKDFKEKSKERSPSEEKFCSWLPGKKLIMKIMSMFLRFGIDLKFKRSKVSRLAVKMWRFVISWCVWKI